MAKSTVTIFINNNQLMQSVATIGDGSHWQTSTTAQCILAPVRNVHALLRQPQNPSLHPSHCSLSHMRNYLRIIGLWPQHGRYYAICNAFIVLLLVIFVLTITCDLYEASGDFVHFGDDLVVLVGLYLILLKIWLFRKHMSEIEDILEEFNLMHARLSQLTAGQREIRQLQRFFYVREIISWFCYILLGICFFVAISVQPLFTDETLPYRIRLPYALHDPAQHPNVYMCLYAFQCICTLYNLIAIILMDNIGSNILSQTALNLRILCVRIRALDESSGPGDDMWAELREIVRFHQHIIALIDRINRLFYSNYVAQMGASTCLICLTALETMLAKNRPMVAFKFQMYMLSAFMQLFYWCIMGNMVYFDSLEVATVAFELKNWFAQSPQFQRNLLFLIQRAQKPLVFRAKPLYAFEIQTFTSILSTSYSYYALLRTMID